MARVDDGLAFMLRFENVARYEDGAVLILDRRIYPAKIEFVRCEDYRAVAKAIGEMVTQSGGPWFAASLGMVSAARTAKGLKAGQAKAFLDEAAYTLTHARPTTSKRMVAYVQTVVDTAWQAMEAGKDPEETAYAYVMARMEERYLKSRRIGEHVVSLLPDDVTILTQCFAENLIGYTLLVAQEQGKQVRLYCPETRPYLQGARLTASVAYDQGVPVTVITDNMPGYLLSKKMVDVFICAADVISLDGYVVNKIGTYQIALAAHENHVPFYVLGSPSPSNPTIDTVKIEERDPQEVLHAMGVRTAKEGVMGFYPAFDITPPKLVSAVIAAEGIFSPYNLAGTFGKGAILDE